MNSTICKKWIVYQCYDVSCPFQHPASDVSSYSYLYQETTVPHRKVDKREFRSAGTIEKSQSQTGSDTLCKYYLAGKCKAGTSCSFRHELPEAQYKRQKTSATTIADSSTKEGSQILEKYSMKHHLKSVLPEEGSSDNRLKPVHKLEGTTSRNADQDVTITIV
jgi:hypothetical protein